MKVFSSALLLLLIPLVIVGLHAPFLKLKVHLSADRTIHVISCDERLAWKVVEKDTFVKGNLIEVGRMSYVRTYRNLQLTSSDSKIAEMTSVDIFEYPYTDYLPGNAHEFPTGEQFIKAYVFRDTGILTDGEPSTTDVSVYKPNPRWQLRIHDSKIDIKDFDTAAQCMYSNLTVLEELIEKQGRGPTDREKPILTQIGWLMLLDSSAVEYKESEKAYRCIDGSLSVVSENLVFGTRKTMDGDYTRNHGVVFGVIGVDGKLYKQAGTFRGIDMTQPSIELSNSPCIDDDGVSFEDAISSIPDRIIFLRK